MEKPLDAEEERLWRALQRVTIALPRVLEDDLLRGTGLSLTEYAVLMNLSEATDRELRMAELASATALSASRITRVVDQLQSRGLVRKRKCEDDGRSNIASLTDEGFRRLEAAYPSHLASARRHVIGHLDPRTTKRLADVLVKVAEQLDPDVTRG
ncbi:MarR family winged helix-turn-helix transcriptional regulator [Kutzneria sp. NPDC052558]|uniref:MarR family winged helix-turn-helix transcriptional regulator n=1 Tax=Kutzneria sp. NPDC052558 TaxID=3364121 RepID=UPI0037C968B3